MTPAHLAHPEWTTPLAAAVASLAALALLSFAVARRRARRLLGSPRWVPRSQLLRDLALVTALAAAGTALLGPSAGMRTLRVSGSGVDVVLLVDVSRSMDATDVPPSRLERARALASSVLAKLGPDDRAALAAFAGRGVLLTPLTPDFDALDEMLASLRHRVDPAERVGSRRRRRRREPRPSRPRANGRACCWRSPTARIPTRATSWAPMRPSARARAW